ncbi:recombinase family protein [Streptomyces sp. NPDC058290]|uniref:recombinase family protein n=1 Tax=Streptomyces sp. NPDC058290 TaxID=3346426 RepID=UPI0036E6693A
MRGSSLRSSNRWPRHRRPPRGDLPQPNRCPGRPWRPGTPPPPAPVDPDLPSADIRIGYARCSTLGQELDSQLDALSKHGIPRDKIFSEKISTRIRVRPKFEEALRTAREVKAHAPHCRVTFTVYIPKGVVRRVATVPSHSSWPRSQMIWSDSLGASDDLVCMERAPGTGPRPGGRAVVSERTSGWPLA